MPEFAYTARTSSGDEVAGTLTASTSNEAIGMLSERDLFPLKVEGGKKAASRFSQQKRVKAQALAATLAQLGDLLESGVPLLRALELLSRPSAYPQLAEVMRDVHDQVAEGATLDEAFSKHPRVFNELTISMVRAGGEGGFLEDVLQRTAAFIEHQEDIKGRVIGAATYPALLAIAGTIAVTVLIVFFVPKFAEMFSRLEEKGELPALTIGLLALSDFLGSYGIFVLIALVGGFFWLVQYAKTERGRWAIDRARLKVPLAGKVYLNLAISRFCRVLGTLLKNGVPILRSLEISSDSTGNKVLADTIRQASENISSGQTLSAPLRACGLFPQTVVEMISVAEESNTLEKVLINVADGMDRRTERQLDLAVRLLEPMMLLVMAVVIMMVVIALLLPVIQMSTSFS